MLQNPHNISAKRFVLMAEMGLRVSDNCNTNIVSYSREFGEAHINDMAMNDDTFFTGSNNVQVEEIEVFEIAN
jgi:hypothetical protein